MGSQHRPGADFGRPSRNFFRSGELHLVLLALLAEAPRHGYELMTALQERFGNAYRPSPGSVYPALSALQAEHLILAEDHGDRRVYRLSALGRAAMEDRRVALRAIEARTGARLIVDDAEQYIAALVQTVRAGIGNVGLKAVQKVLATPQEQIEALVDEARRTE